MPLALALACAVAFVGAIWSLIWVPIGAVLAFLVMAAWHWPAHDERTPPWRHAPPRTQEAP
jgi:hypothetical protein